MRTDEPSRTARGVALIRSRLERLPWATGDPDADQRLTTDLLGDWTGAEHMGRTSTRDVLLGWVETRTDFFDAAVVDALRAGVRQIVILGAGYDGRAMRYRTPGVTFFEVDHPATQADKRARLDTVRASTEGIAFVAADFTEPGLGAALASAGHDAGASTQYVCEGVLRYLPEEWLIELLRVMAERTVPGGPAGRERLDA